MKLPQSIEKLINEFSKLPGIGHKSAQRLALYLLKRSSVELELLSSAVGHLKEGVVFCSTCHNMAENDPCSTCTDSKRDQSLLCVVEEPLDTVAIDKSQAFNGVFHVLGGALNPLEGVSVEQLNLSDLEQRIQDQGVTEIILATNPTLEGEATAMYIARMLKDSPIKLTRIARGLPMGGQLEYADEMTLTRALEGRKDF